MRMQQEAEELIARQDWRRAADKYRESFEFLPPHFLLRFWVLDGYIDVINKHEAMVTERDLEFLQKVRKNTQESILHRAGACFSLGFQQWARRERELAAKLYRKTIAFWGKCSEDEKKRIVYIVDTRTFRLKGVPLVEVLQERFIRHAQENLSVLEDGRPLFPPGPESDENPNLAIRLDLKIEPGPYLKPEDAKRVSENSTVKGQRCDHCRIGPIDKEGVKLRECGRCRHAYYCSKPCQVAAWSAGHKLVCRPPTEFIKNDLVSLKELTGTPSLNDYLGYIKNKADAEDRWVVRLLGSGREISVKTKNIVMVSPAAKSAS